MYKTDNTRKLVEMNSFLPNLTKVEFKDIYHKNKGTKTQRNSNSFATW